MTNLPLDSTYMMQEMINYKKGETCGYSSIFWSDLTSHFVGDTIKTIRTWVPKGGNGDVTFYILDELNGDVLWMSEMTDVPMTQMISIPCSYVMEEAKDIEVGFIFEFVKDTDNEIAVIPCFRDLTWIMAPSSEQYSYNYSNMYMEFGMSDNYYGLPFYLEMAGDAGLKPYDLTLDGVSFQRTWVGEETEFNVSVTNYSYMPVDSVDYIYALGTDTLSAHSSEPIPYLATKELGSSVRAGDEAKRDPLYVSVTTAGHTYEALGGVITVDLDNSYSRTILMEEFTGMWCGNCPRGITAMEVLGEELGPENFIPVAVHGGDALEVEELSPILALGRGIFPRSSINRYYFCDPYYGQQADEPMGINEIIGFVRNLPTEATIRIDEATLSADQKTIHVSTAAEFAIESPTAPYAIGFLITEDGVPGYQTNYIGGDSDYKDEPYLKEFYSQPSIISPYAFNHVARGVVGPMGIEGSIEDGPLSMYDVRPYSCDITLPTNIRKLENCHLIAFLIDKQTEDIVNACTLPIQSLLGIGTPSADDADTDVVTRYNVAGQRIASPATGLQLLHHADGTVEKVMK